MWVSIQCFQLGQESKVLGIVHRVVLVSDPREEEWQGETELFDTNLTREASLQDSLELEKFPFLFFFLFIPRRWNIEFSSIAKIDLSK